MFNNNLGYIYIIFNQNKEYIKIGSTCDYEKRYYNYKTYSSFPWEYIKVYEILDKNINEDDSKENCYDIDNKIQKEYTQYLTKNCMNECKDGGIEWYVNKNELINKIDYYLKTNFAIKEVDKDKLNYKNFKINNQWKNIKPDILELKINNFIINEINYKLKMTRPKPREYQTSYINNCFTLLMSFFAKCLMIAPTGSGKTFMFYSIARKILKEKRKEKKKAKVNIVILSPRLSINKQTVSDSNRNLLSSDNNFIKINAKDFKKSNTKYNDKIKNKNINFIISSTYQSIEKLSTFIKENKITIDLVIFDECHFIKNWGTKENNNDETKHSVKHLKSIEFIMKDTSLIKKRLFCSATPFECQRTEVEIYGESVEYVKVGDLINAGYLCPIKTILKDYKDETSLTNLILKEKISKNKKKTIIFCNTQANCRSLFGQIQKVINKNGLDIKPYLYIGKSKGDKVNMNETDDDILSAFEKDEECSLIITCKKISMGYDYPKIDFVVFADAKCEKIDIAQCIGRGLRITDDPDKVCHVLLPVNEEEAEDSKFKTIISYFKYMRNECGYEIINDSCWYETKKNPDYVPKEGNNYGFELECSFDDNKLKTKIIDKYCVEKKKEESIINKNSNIILSSNLTNSKINEYIIKNDTVIISEKKKHYRTILNDIWNSMKRKYIVKNTTFNFKETNENGLKGFSWNKNLKMSIQGKDANGTIKEIFKMVKLNNYKIDVSIKLKNGKDIKYKN